MGTASTWVLTTEDSTSDRVRPCAPHMTTLGYSCLCGSWLKVRLYLHLHYSPMIPAFANKCELTAGSRHDDGTVQSVIGKHYVRALLPTAMVSTMPSLRLPRHDGPALCTTSVKHFARQSRETTVILACRNNQPEYWLPRMAAVSIMITLPALDI